MKNFCSKINRKNKHFYLKIPQKFMTSRQILKDQIKFIKFFIILNLNEFKQFQKKTLN